jgi:hypothetical protein
MAIGECGVFAIRFSEWQMHSPLALQILTL